MSRYNTDRMKAANNDLTLYKIIEILDDANLGRLAKSQAGEYASEAKMILKHQPVYRSYRDVYRELISVMRLQFGWRILPIFRAKYIKCARKIWPLVCPKDKLL